MINRFASPCPILPGRRRGRVSRFNRSGVSYRPGLAVALLLPLALCGCGEKSPDPELQARIEKLEKKVDAADRRSHQAIGLAMQQGSGSQASFGEVPEINDAPVDPVPEEFSTGEDQDGIPPSPALGPDS